MRGVFREERFKGGDGGRGSGTAGPWLRCGMTKKNPEARIQKSEVRMQVRVSREPYGFVTASSGRGSWQGTALAPNNGMTRPKRNSEDRRQRSQNAGARFARTIRICNRFLRSRLLAGHGPAPRTTVWRCPHSLSWPCSTGSPTSGKWCSSDTEPCRHLPKTVTQSRVGAYKY
jgi:hypothetical protein